MGANAQTSVPAFTAGQVLTAQQQTEINTGVPVFATTTTRDAAFGGTGEKVLAEGQLAYIEASDVVQYYNGTVWATLAPASAGALVYVTGTTFSAVTSVSLPNSTFTSTYRNYKVVFTITDASADNAAVTMRLRASGADNTTSNYSSITTGVAFGGTTQYNTNTSAGTSFGMNLTRGTFTNDYGSFVFDILDPQQSVATQYAGSNIGKVSSSLTGAAFIGGAFDGTTAFDSLSIIVATGNITGYYRVYGYGDS